MQIVSPDSQPNNTKTKFSNLRARESILLPSQRNVHLTDRDTEFEPGDPPEAALSLVTMNRDSEEFWSSNLPDSIGSRVHRERTEPVKRLKDTQCETEGATENQNMAPDPALHQQGIGRSLANNI